MARTTTIPKAAESERRGLSARVSLGAAFKPVPLEFLLIASAALLLTIFGILMVFSATTVTSMQAQNNPYNDGAKHAVFAAVGVPLMFIVSRFSMAWLKRLAWPALIGAILLQLLVFTPLGMENGGNRNWLNFGFMSVQPSEFIKLGLAIWCAFMLDRKKAVLGKWKHVLIPLGPVAVLAMGTVMAGKDLGTVMVIALVVLGALFFSGVKLRFFIAPVLAAVAAVAAFAIASPNRMLRIMSVLDQSCLDRYLNECYQPLHGIWGLASGGFLGLGLGNSKEKYDWLPAAADDYIFAIVGEELGLLGCIAVLALFLVFALGAFRIVSRADDLFVRVVAGALGVWIIGQALINIGVVLRVFPALGVPLPFLSSGGSSLIAVLLASGVLLACARTLPDRPARRA
ncbi:putative lipid II flippase FtsW [Microbacterium barkeri]|uniref:putative lipid II flippase FtsW n=1 Tax=Microbacterium barkeri TaxID=33917 RepID=UPI0024AF348B|nr:putative lipid II flippase FtsW [Microbacterium barkeri]MDI6943549.1 putative lipid II flippase FtsW [Microbacterium barkeri]